MVALKRYFYHLLIDHIIHYSLGNFFFLTFTLFLHIKQNEEWFSAFWGSKWVLNSIKGFTGVQPLSTFPARVEELIRGTCGCLWCRGHSSKEHWSHLKHLVFHSRKSVSSECSQSGKFGVYNRKDCFLQLTSLLLPKWKSAWICSECNIQCYIVLQVQSACKIRVCNILNLFVHMQSVVFVYRICFMPIFSSSLMSRILNVLLWKCRLLLLWK